VFVRISIQYRVDKQFMVWIREFKSGTVKQAQEKVDYGFHHDNGHDETNSLAFGRRTQRLIELGF
jgi:hypothetical protein